MLTDPTATFPRRRWTEMMRQLAARGGAPHPIIAYARVGDLDADTVRVMVRANVRSLFIGQESGDPQILSKMRKGTSISQVQACITALTNSPITVTMGFIHGFPGETPGTMRATREMICSLNRGTGGNPVVTEVALSPFMPQDLASVSYDERLIEKKVPTELAIEELLATFIASSQVRHRPYFFYRAICTFAKDEQAGIIWMV